MYEDMVSALEAVRVSRNTNPLLLIEEEKWPIKISPTMLFSHAEAAANKLMEDFIHQPVPLVAVVKPIAVWT
jgi:hypothetical protein